MSENEAIALAQKGDPEAFRVLYELHKSTVLQRCMYMLRDREEAEDVTQEIFLLLYRKIKHFRCESSFSTWLYRMTTTKVLDSVRYKRARIPSGADTENMAHPSIDPKPLLKLELEQAISSLSTQEQQILALREQGFTLQEIAQMSGWRCKATARTHIQNTHRTLRAAMA